jgi:putative heme utilization carrier protein HutX
MTSAETIPDTLPRECTVPLLRALPELGNTTTVVLHGGCVFEFKGPFPPGTEAEGHYNLDGPTPGFHGHLRLETMAGVRFQDRPHRGRASYAFVFENDKGGCLFKVFLGRDSDGEIIKSQLNFFRQLRESRRLPLNPQPLTSQPLNRQPLNMEPES